MFDIFCLFNCVSGPTVVMLGCNAEVPGSTVNCWNVSQFCRHFHGRLTLPGPPGRSKMFIQYVDDTSPVLPSIAINHSYGA